MMSWHFGTESSGWLFLLTLAVISQVFSASAAQASDLLRASACFMAGDLNLTLTCTPGHHLMALSAFAGISRTNVCSYEPWDCIVRGGTIGQCDHRSMCRLTMSRLQQEGLGCGGQALTIYMQVEYRCLITVNKKKPLKVSAVASVTVTLPKRTDHLVTNRTDRLVTNRTNHKPPADMSTPTPGETKTTTGNTWLSLKSVLEDKATFLLLVGGGLFALVLVVAVIAVLVHKLKRRSYPNSVLYGAPHIEAFNPRTVRHVRRFPHRGHHQSRVTTVYDGQSSSYSR